MPVQAPKLSVLAGLLGRAKEKLAAFSPSDALYKTLTGFKEKELYDVGKQMYPKVPPGSAHHRLASKRVTQRFGPLGAIGAQLGGLAMEDFERLKAGDPTAPDYIQDTNEDLKQNLLGAGEQLGEDWNNFKQLFRR